MNKNEYINTLRKKLKKLPQDELNSAIEFYEEYFAESKNEEEAMKSLGTPGEAASKIIGEFAVQKPLKRPIKTLLIVLSGIFASPIAVPLAISALAIIFAILIVLISIFISFWALGVGFGFIGIASLICGIILFAKDIATAVFFTGMGLFLMAGGTAVFIGTVNLFKVTFKAIVSLIGKKLIRRGSR